MAWTFKPKRAPKQKENNNKAFAAIAVAAAGAGMLGVYKLGTWSERGPEQRNDPESPWSFSALPPDPPPPPKPDNDKPEPKTVRRAYRHCVLLGPIPGTGAQVPGKAFA